MKRNIKTAKIHEDMKSALKAGEKERVTTLRMLLSELKNAQIARGEELEEDEEIAVLSSYIRRCKESIEEFERGGREDLVARTRSELEIVSSYMPEQLGMEEIADEVKKVIEEMGASGSRDMGRVMGEMMRRFKGRVDGRAVNTVVSRMLKNG
jgi:uncharacterized protein YqeY